LRARSNEKEAESETEIGDCRFSFNPEPTATAGGILDDARRRRWLRVKRICLNDLGSGYRKYGPSARPVACKGLIGTGPGTRCMAA
jgi:hypothetical protein